MWSFLVILFLSFLHGSTEALAPPFSSIASPMKQQREEAFVLFENEKRTAARIFHSWKNQLRPSSSSTSPHIFQWWSHPLKSRVDIFLGYLVGRHMLGLRGPPPKTSTAENRIISDDGAKMAYVNELRTKLAKVENDNNGYREWAEAAETDIVEVTLTIKRDDKLLRDWGMTKEPEFDLVSLSMKLLRGWGILKGLEETGLSSLPKNKDVTVHLAFPRTILPAAAKVSAERNEYGCLVSNDQSILRKLPKDVPLVVSFHGGGLTVGASRSTIETDVLLGSLKRSVDENGKPQPVILASVDYSLAPEHPFPTAPLEASSVLNHVLDLGFSKVHSFGASAGGHLSLLAALNVCRSHKRKASLLSVFAVAPMISPAADTLSYYQNSKSSHGAPVDWLRWCYQEYLGLPEATSTRVATDTKALSLESVLAVGSNRHAWNESKWKQSYVRRLIELTVDLPPGLKDGPAFCISTNAADPLHDEGIDMVNALDTSGAKIQHLDHKGSHIFGTTLDKELYGEVSTELGKEMFP